MSICIQCNSYNRMLHQVLKRFRIHSRFCHIAAISMTAYMGSDFWQLLFIDTVVFRQCPLKISNFPKSRIRTSCHIFLKDVWKFSASDCPACHGIRSHRSYVEITQHRRRTIPIQYTGNMFHYRWRNRIWGCWSSVWNSFYPLSMHITANISILMISPKLRQSYSAMK